MSYDVPDEVRDIDYLEYMDNTSDETLIQRYLKNGDMEAFTMLYTRHKDPLYRYCLRNCGNTANTEEIFQEIWASLIKSNYRTQRNASFKTYLYTIARHKLIDYYRRQNISLVELDDETIAPQDKPHQETLDDVLSAIEQLPPAQKEVVILRLEQELDFDEIAAISQCKTETARSRYRYAIAKLNELLGQKHE